MKESGVVLHQAKSGRLIVKLSRKLQPGSEMLDDKGRKLGKVLELIGPVDAPYASVGVATSKLGKAGDKTYTSE